MKKIVLLTVKRRGRVTSQEVGLLKNEGLTMSGRYKTRFAEIQAIYKNDPDVTVKRSIIGEWPVWAK